MNCSLAQTFQLDCSVCFQSITHEKQRESAQLDVLFGSLKYAICPCCSQQVSDATFKDKRYRRRCDRLIAKLERERRPRVDHWFDRSLRLWTVIKKDADGNQIGEASYCLRAQLKREILDAEVELFNFINQQQKEQHEN